MSIHLLEDSPPSWQVTCDECTIQGSVAETAEKALTNFFLTLDGGVLCEACRLRMEVKREDWLVRYNLDEGTRYFREGQLQVLSNDPNVASLVQVTPDTWMIRFVPGAHEPADVQLAASLRPRLVRARQVRSLQVLTRYERLLGKDLIDD